MTTGTLLPGRERRERVISEVLAGHLSGRARELHDRAGREQLQEAPRRMCEQRAAAERDARAAAIDLCVGGAALVDVAEARRGAREHASRAERLHGQHLEAFASVSLLNAKFTASAIPDQVGKVPAYAPRYLAKAGLTWRVEQRVKLSFTAVSSAAQYWQDSDLPLGSGASYLPARIPAYTVLDLAGDWQLDRHVKLLAGISNLANRRYYDRVWQTGLEPAYGRSWYTGVKLDL